MALTVGEANAVNVLLRHVIGQRDPALAEWPDEHYEALGRAAVLLAEKAHKALFAGLTPDQVRAAFHIDTKDS